LLIVLQIKYSLKMQPNVKHAQTIQHQRTILVKLLDVECIKSFLMMDHAWTVKMRRYLILSKEDAFDFNVVADTFFPKIKETVSHVLHIQDPSRMVKYVRPTIASSVILSLMNKENVKLVLME